MWLKGLENILKRKIYIYDMQDWVLSVWKRMSMMGKIKIILIIKEDVYGWCLVINIYVLLLLY